MPENTPIDPSRGLRSSDSDRERTASILRDAAAEGRLDIHELDERLAQVYAARTYAELEPLTADLPVAQPQRAAGRTPGDRMTRVAVMSGFEIKGRHVLPRFLRCIAFWGGGDIDLREAVIPPEGLTINAIAVMGGLDIVVPEDANVHVTGVGVMGGFDQPPGAAGTVTGPVVTISGLAFWGGVDVKRRPRKPPTP